MEHKSGREPSSDITTDNADLHPQLSTDQIDRLRSFGREEETRPGDLLFQEGDPGYDFFVILEGVVEIVDRSAEEEKVIAIDGPGLFLGELNMLTGQTPYLAARVRDAGRVLRIRPDRLRDVIGEEPQLSDLILKAFIARRAHLVEEATATLKIVGSRFSPETLRLREFARRNQLPHTWIDLEADEETEALLRSFDVAPEETPVVIWQGDEVLKNPTTGELAQHIGLASGADADETVDLIVVGAGPAGLAASVYGASEGLQTLCFDETATGGQAGTSSKIENYPGFPAGLSGEELANRMAVQARKFDARFRVPCAATALRRDGGDFALDLDGGGTARGRAVIVATGAQYRKLPLDHLEEFEGAGVYYAATELEAQVCRGETVTVVGGGNSAGQAAMFLSEHARTVHVLIRGTDLSTSMSRYLLSRIERKANVEVHAQTEVRALHGEGSLGAITIEDNESGQQRRIETPALFVFIGAEPCTGWLPEALALDEGGFALTGRALRREEGDVWGRIGRGPLLLETSWPGVFAAGDVRAGSTKRVASAVGEGSIAVKLVHQFLDVGG